MLAGERPALTLRNAVRFSDRVHRLRPAEIVGILGSPWLYLSTRACESGVGKTDSAGPELHPWSPGDERQESQLCVAYSDAAGCDASREARRERHDFDPEESCRIPQTARFADNLATHRVMRYSA